jgi:hypothetical protein
MSNDVKNLLAALPAETTRELPELVRIHDQTGADIETMAAGVVPAVAHRLAKERGLCPDCEREAVSIARQQATDIAHSVVSRGLLRVAAAMR